MNALFILKWGVHVKDDPQLTGVYIVSFLVIFVLIAIFIYIKNKIMNQDEDIFEHSKLALGLAILVTLIYWIAR